MILMLTMCVVDTLHHATTKSYRINHLGPQRPSPPPPPPPTAPRLWDRDIKRKENFPPV